MKVICFYLKYTFSDLMMLLLQASVILFQNSIQYFIRTTRVTMMSSLLAFLSKIIPHRQAICYEASLNLFSLSAYSKKSVEGVSFAVLRRYAFSISLDLQRRLPSLILLCQWRSSNFQLIRTLEIASQLLLPCFSRCKPLSIINSKAGIRIIKCYPRPCTEFPYPPRHSFADCLKSVNC